MADTGVTYVQAPPGTTVSATENEPRRLAEKALLMDMQARRQELASRGRERVGQVERGGR